MILHSGGGVMTPETADRFAVRLAASGIAAGAIASRHIAQLCGFENAIGFDMGGTSTDISLVYQGEERITNEWSVEYGYPICFPSIEVLTIGAGGGSLAWIDEAGSLRNGPAVGGRRRPGPACYGQGGDEPTNTDANLVLGRLGDAADRRRDDARRRGGRAGAATRVAEPLGLELHEAAEAVLAVANANMADAIRLISVRRGYDPRDFALVCFGGAGPLHGAELARELSIPTVLVPPNPGTTSALGCLLVDIRHDFFTLLLGDADDADPAEVEREFAALEEQARERMRAEGVARRPRDAPAHDRHALRGPVALDRGARRGRGEFARRPASRAFQPSTSASTPTAATAAPVELYRLNLRAVGVTQKAELARHERAARCPRRSRDAHGPLRRRGGAGHAGLPARRPPAPGATFDGPGGRRAARLHRGRPAGRRARGRRVAEHPDDDRRWRLP